MCGRDVTPSVYYASIEKASLGSVYVMTRAVGALPFLVFLFLLIFPDELFENGERRANRGPWRELVRVRET